MSEPAIRVARAADLPVLVDLWWAMQEQHRAYDAVFYGDRGAALCRRECEHYLAAQLDDPTARLLVAEADGALVGLLLGQFRPRPPIFTVRRQFVIELAATVPAWRRRGVFSALLDEARRLASREGVGLLQLNADAANAEALAAYARRGFAPRQMVLVSWHEPGERDA